VDKKDSAFWVPAVNTLAVNEIDAHTGMFAGTTNDGYYQLGLDTVSVVRLDIGDWCMNTYAILRLERQS
jgi:hypothetical protein